MVLPLQMRRKTFCQVECQLDWQDQQFLPLFYVRQLMAQRLKIPKEEIQLSPDIIEIETLRLRLVRAAREIKTKTHEKEHQNQHLGHVKARNQRRARVNPSRVAVG